MNLSLDKQQRGLIMAVIGSVMILVNALDYIFDWHFSQPAFAIVGMIFVAIGTGWRKKRSQE